MLLLHLDKRVLSAEALAGGKEKCDRAMHLVQRAYETVCATTEHAWIKKPGVSSEEKLGLLGGRDHCPKYVLSFMNWRWTTLKTLVFGLRLWPKRSWLRQLKMAVVGQSFASADGAKEGANEMTSNDLDTKPLHLRLPDLFMRTWPIDIAMLIGAELGLRGAALWNRCSCSR